MGMVMNILRTIIILLGGGEEAESKDVEIDGEIAIDEPAPPGFQV